MTLREQADARFAQAERLGSRPIGWIAAPGVAAELSDDSGQLVGLPIVIGDPRSEWGLELVAERAAA